MTVWCALCLQPAYLSRGSGASVSFILINGIAMMGDREPAAGIFQITAIFLKAIGIIRAAKYIHASITIGCFKGFENQMPDRHYGRSA